MMMLTLLVSFVGYTTLLVLPACGEIVDRSWGRAKDDKGNACRYNSRGCC